MKINIKKTREWNNFNNLTNLNIEKAKKPKTNIKTFDYLSLEQPCSIIDFMHSDDYVEGNSISTKEFFEYYFPRNPLRFVRANNRQIKAFADGILIYQGRFKGNRKILEVKGKKYTVADILQEPEDKVKDKSFYVLSIYLTSYSVHVIRMPLTGYILSIENLEPLTTKNLPMVLFENTLLDKRVFNPDLLEYDFYNQRTIIRFFSPVLKTNCYLVLVADCDVDKNLLFVQEDELVMQGQRVAYVMWGSEAILLIEARDWFRIRKLIRDYFYVYAPTCSLWEIAFRRKVI